MGIKAKPASERDPISLKVPETYDEAETFIRQITEHRKELARLQLNMRLQMAALDRQYRELSMPHLEAINLLSQHLGIWKQTNPEAKESPS